jgi:lysyl-tRNA synthetase class 2
VQRKPVESSVVAAVGYAEPNGILEIEFRTGRVYWYFDVPRREYEALLHAPSIGQYFNTRIRDRYRAQEVRMREDAPR